MFPIFPFFTCLQEEWMKVSWSCFVCVCFVLRSTSRNIIEDQTFSLTLQRGKSEKTCCCCCWPVLKRDETKEGDEKKMETHLHLRAIDQFDRVLIVYSYESACQRVRPYERETRRAKARWRTPGFLLLPAIRSFALMRGALRTISWRASMFDWVILPGRKTCESSETVRWHSVKRRALRRLPCCGNRSTVAGCMCAPVPTRFTRAGKSVCDAGGCCDKLAHWASTLPLKMDCTEKVVMRNVFLFYCS